MTATIASMTRSDAAIVVGLSKVTGGWSAETPENLPKDLYSVRYQATDIDQYDLLDTRDDATADVLALLRADEERDNNFYRRRDRDSGTVLVQKRRAKIGDLIQLTEE